MIPLRNWFVLLAFAWRDIGLVSGRMLDACAFDRPDDVAARLLDELLGRLLRRGLEQRFASFDDTGPRPRGAIDLATTLRHRLESRGQLAFRYEDLSVDTPANRPLACAVRLLLRSTDVDDAVGLRLRQHAAALAAVSRLTPTAALALHVTAPRHERTYGEALWLARLVLVGHLADDDGHSGNDGVRRPELMERLPQLFEGFVRGAARHYGDDDTSVKSETFAWHAVASARGQALLPQMRIDACIRWSDGPVVAVECKAYREPLVAHHRGDAAKLRAAHLYQLMSYLAVLRRREQRRALGLLVYARVDATIDETFTLDDAGVRVVTLDLAAPWPQLRPHLVDVVRWRGSALPFDDDLSATAHAAS